jgi:hypothetical protein
MRKLVACLLSCFVLGCGRDLHAQACDSLDADGKKAIGYLVDDAYGSASARSEDNDEVRWSRNIVLQNGKKTLPCLLEIYRSGLTKSKLWSGRDNKPTSGKWTITLIREIDPKSAIPLYRELHAETSDALSKIQMGAELAILGEPQYLDELVDFLDNPPAFPKERIGDLTHVQERALIAISVQDHRDALPALKKLENTWPYKHVIQVYIAQLSGDASSLERYVGDPRVTNISLQALRRMGREEVVRAIADDPKSPAQKAARAVLDGKIGP